MTQEHMTQEEVFLLEELDELYRELEAYEKVKEAYEKVKAVFVIQEIRDKERHYASYCHYPSSCSAGS